MFIPVSNDYIVEEFDEDICMYIDGKTYVSAVTIICPSAEEHAAHTGRCGPTYVNNDINMRKILIMECYLRTDSYNVSTWIYKE